MAEVLDENIRKALGMPKLDGVERSPVEQRVIKPCPCGATPKTLCLMDTGQGGKWAIAGCDVCGEWNIEFRTKYLALDSDECMELAIADWNRAPRAL